MLFNLTEPVTHRSGDSVVLSLEDESLSAFPYPTTFQWSKDGVALQNDSRRQLGYPIFNLSTLEPSDSGTYSLTATNYSPENSQVIWTGNGQFTLNVLCELDIKTSRLFGV